MMPVIVGRDDRRILVQGMTLRGSPTAITPILSSANLCLSNFFFLTGNMRGEHIKIFCTDLANHGTR